VVRESESSLGRAGGSGDGRMLVDARRASDGWMDGGGAATRKGRGKQAGPAFPVPGDSGVGTRVARCNGASRSRVRYVE
jgi:hypothetical protein